MPKPNRYQGNGKLYPEGTVMGRYVMRRGHWVDVDSPVGRSSGPSAKERSTIGGWLVSTMLGLVCFFMIIGLMGCSVNVVTIHSSDIGVAVESLKDESVKTDQSRGVKL